MATFTNTTQLPASREQVFALLTDFKRSPEWQTIHSGWPAGEPDGIAVGGSFKQQVTLMGMPAEVTWTVKQLEAPSALELEGVGPMGTTLRTRFSLADADGGSQLTVENELGGGALAGAMGETVAAQSRSAQEESLERLKGLVS